MPPRKLPSVNELHGHYQTAKTRSDTFFAEAPKPLSEEDQATHQWLNNLALDALAKFYAAGGTTNPNLQRENN